MKPNQKLHQAKLYEWTARIADQKNSGLTVPCWCEQNHLSIHAYNYWKHQLKQEAVDQILPDIVPLSIPSPKQTLSDISSSESSYHSDTPDPSGANCAIRANCANSSKASLIVNGTTIEVDSSVSEAFLTTILRAVRHA